MLAINLNCASRHVVFQRPVVVLNLGLLVTLVLMAASPSSVPLGAMHDKSDSVTVSRRPCVIFTVNAPVTNHDVTECDTLDFTYAKDGPRTGHWGKIFFFMELLISKKYSLVVYKDWDVRLTPMAFKTAAGKIVMPAGNRQEFSSNVIVFRESASEPDTARTMEALKTWYAATHLIRDDGLFEQSVGNKLFNCSSSEEIVCQAEPMTGAHCHHSLINRRDCVVGETRNAVRFLDTDQFRMLAATLSVNVVGFYPIFLWTRSLIWTGLAGRMAHSAIEELIPYIRFRFEEAEWKELVQTEAYDNTCLKKAKAMIKYGIRKYAGFTQIDAYPMTCNGRDVTALRVDGHRISLKLVSWKKALHAINGKRRPDRKKSVDWNRLIFRWCIDLFLGVLMRYCIVILDPVGSAAIRKSTAEQFRLDGLFGRIFVKGENSKRKDFSYQNAAVPGLQIPVFPRLSAFGVGTASPR